MSSAPSHRIDSASTPVPRMASAGPRLSVRRPVLAGHPRGEANTQPEPEPASDPTDWLQLHAADLIDRLINWAADLDAREAQLNARASLQDHRERESRLRQQIVAAEFAEQQRSLERLRREAEAEARRLAFGTHTD